MLRSLPTARSLLIWAGFVLAIFVPVTAAAFSPYLAYRDAIYVTGGFAGIVGLTLLLIQPLLAAALLPGVPARTARHLHWWAGASLVVAVVAHVVALWITSPPDVIDVLTFTSPTPFSVWGNLALWAVFGAAVLAALRRRLRLRPALWRNLHVSFTIVIVVGTITHAMLIEGTMDTLSKTILCLLVACATLVAIAARRGWIAIFNRRAQP